MLLVFCCKQTHAPEPLPGGCGFPVVVIAHEVLKRLGDDCSVEQLVSATQFPGTRGTLVSIPPEQVLLDDLLLAAMTPEGHEA